MVAHGALSRRSNPTTRHAAFSKANANSRERDGDPLECNRPEPQHPRCTGLTRPGLRRSLEPQQPRNRGRMTPRQQRLSVGLLQLRPLWQLGAQKPGEHGLRCEVTLPDASRW